MHLLPGLIDLHVHYPPWFVPGQADLFDALFLAHGVTTARETGSFGSRIFAHRDAIASGRRAGPRIFACGAVLDGDPPSWPLARAVRDAAEARAAVDELAAEGASCIKVMSRIPDASLDAVRDAAHARGLRVIGHLPAGSGFGEKRLDEIEHVCDPHCWELGPRGIEELVATAKRHGIAHVPTLAVYAGQLRSYAYETEVRSPLAMLMPRFWRDVIWNPAFGLGFTGRPGGGAAVDEAPRRRVAATIREAVRQLHDAGVRVLPGTDPFNPFVVPGASLHEELRLLVESGLSVQEAGDAATWQAGEALGVPGLGRIEPGAPADLLIFREDPTRDLRALDTLEAVIANGRLYTKAELDEALARQRAFFESIWFYRPSVWLAEIAARGLARWH
jgi:imidazolonepropionase-like amidohydrolase